MNVLAPSQLRALSELYYPTMMTQVPSPTRIGVTICSSIPSALSKMKRYTTTTVFYEWHTLSKPECRKLSRHTRTSNICRTHDSIFTAVMIEKRILVPALLWEKTACGYSHFGSRGREQNGERTVLPLGRNASREVRTSLPRTHAAIPKFSFPSSGSKHSLVYWKTETKFLCIPLFVTTFSFRADLYSSASTTNRTDMPLSRYTILLFQVSCRGCSHLKILSCLVTLTGKTQIIKSKLKPGTLKTTPCLWRCSSLLRRVEFTFATNLVAIFIMTDIIEFFARVAVFVLSATLFNAVFFETVLTFAAFREIHGFKTH